MKALILIFAMLVAAHLLAGCSSLPSMQYCDKVEYKRDGSNIHLEADCHAPVGGSLPGL